MEKEQMKKEYPERFDREHVIAREKLEMAAESALRKLEDRVKHYVASFPGTVSVNQRYTQGPNNNWTCGMSTGTYILAHELSGNKIFRDVAEEQLLTYVERFDKKVGMDDHDVGFAYSPSCVTAYKLWGEEKWKKLALDVAEYYYNQSYSEKGGFIIRCANFAQEEWACRTMMDTLLNIPFLFWAGKESGIEKYTKAAESQTNITRQYLIREDGSSFHHYQFDVETHAPMRGVTWQGYADDSCWSRGQAWGIVGFPIAYDYMRDEGIIELHKKVTYYMLNNLSDDLIPKWDLIFKDDDSQYKDSSAAVVTVCGMLEMCKYLPNDAPQKKVYQSAAAQILEAVIDTCAEESEQEYDGLIRHVAFAVPQGKGFDECALYGDYFYLEALVRFLKPEWERCW